jgi:uncharacterized protein YjaG (DUF416 family)
MSQKIYSFDVFKALTEIEIERVNRRKEPSQFSIVFLYFLKEEKDIDVISKLRENLRSIDIISSADSYLIFIFLPEIDKRQVYTLIERLRKIIDIDFIEGVVSYPEDGKTARELFNKMVNLMNDKLVPIVEI